MDRSNGSNQSLWILGGVIAGACLGYYLPEFMLATDFIGIFFMGALGVIIVPLLISSLIGKISELGDLQKIGRVSSRVFGYFLGTSTIAVLIGIAFVIILQPGSSVSPDSPALTSWPGTINDLLAGLLPFNIIAGISTGQFLGLTLLFIILGSLLFSSGIKGRSVTTFFRELNSILTDATSLLLKVAPIGLLSLIGATIAKDDAIFADAGKTLGMLILTVFLALVVYGFIILPLILRFLGSESPFKFIAKLTPALLTGLSTASSAATYPVTYNCITSNSDIDNRSASFILPLGMSLNAGGSAIFLVVTTLFLTQMAGISLGIVEILTIAGVSLLASFLLGGIPSAALLALPVVIATSGLPLSVTAGIGMIVAIDWLMDRGRTVVNIWSDAVGVAVIADTYEFKTARRGLKPRPPLRGSTTSSRAPRGTSRRVDNTRSDRPERRDRKDGRRGEEHRTNDRSSSRVVRKDRQTDETKDSRSGRSRSTERSGTGRTRSNRETASSPFDLTTTTTSPTIGMPDIPIKEKGISSDKSKTASETNNVSRTASKKDGRSVKETGKTKERRPARTRKPASVAVPTAVSANIDEPPKVTADKRVISKVLEPSRQTSPLKKKIDPDIIARELASVSAHLELKNGKKGTEDITILPIEPQQTEINISLEPIATPVKVEDNKPEEAVAIKQSEMIETKANLEAIVEDNPTAVANQDNKPEIMEPVVVEASVDLNESKPEIMEPAVVEASAPVQFGRAKSKRGDALKKNAKDKAASKKGTEEASEKSTPAEKLDNYTTDGAEFGRGKKKRVR